MIPLDFLTISERLRQTALPQVDLVVGISTGGIVPASLVAHQLGVDLNIVKINYRDSANTPRYAQPKLLEAFDLESIHQKRILLVDDVSVTGKTLNFVKNLLEQTEVITLVCKGKADLVLFPEIQTCVRWPWKIE